MSHLRFQHLFTALLLMCLITGFVLPGRYSDRMHPEIQALFVPVSMPVGAIAKKVRESVHPDTTADRRADDDIRRENQELRSELSRMGDQLRILEELNNERAKIGPLRDYGVPFAVLGGDPGPRESLQIRGSSFQGLAQGMPVVYAGGIAGQVQRAGIAGAQVRLITDTGFRIRASFKRYVKENGELKPVPIPNLVKIAEGYGRNRIIVPRVTMEEVNASGLKVGDVLVLDDPDWPSILKGTYLGHVTVAERSKTTPGFADVRVEPQQVLLRLREVLVVTKAE